MEATGADLLIFLKLRNRLIGLHHSIIVFISSFIQILDSSRNNQLDMFLILATKMHILHVFMRPDRKFDYSSSILSFPKVYILIVRERGHERVGNDERELRIFELE